MDSKRTLRTTVVTVATTALLTGGAATAAHADENPAFGPPIAGSQAPREPGPAEPGSRPGAPGGSEPAAQTGSGSGPDHQSGSGPEKPGADAKADTEADAKADAKADSAPERVPDPEDAPELTTKRRPGHAIEPTRAHEGVRTTRAKPRNAAVQRARRLLRASALRGGNIAVKTFAFHMVTQRAWSRAQFRCLDHLWTRESNWNHRATNRSSGAYGIPQALPASKMSVSGHDWRVNPKTQIKWGLRYIRSRYGTPCAAWAHFRSRGWY